jgi:hypothetical protein
VILGNNGTYDLSFYGSFKDVRIWKTSRTDTELMSYRFKQVEAQESLAGNMKFMDGSPYIKNSATINLSGMQFASFEPNMQLLPSDGTNIICGTDTYFDPVIQECTRFPYTSDVSIVYLVDNNVQNGHRMILE